MPDNVDPTDLNPVVVAIVETEDGHAFQLSITSASRDGAQEMKVLPDRYATRSQAAEGARRVYPDAVIKGETSS